MRCRWSRVIDTMSYLRDATRDAHERLETRLDLLSPGLDAGRMVAVLRRFYGFHVVWEPALAGSGELCALTAGRNRQAHLEVDLAGLGVARAEILASPRCHAASELCRTPASALGSLYVMEGSTLGGKVIARSLAGADWLPPAGLTYFAGYGERTGIMWRALQDSLRRQEGDAVTQIGVGASATFDLLTEWMAG